MSSFFEKIKKSSEFPFFLNTIKEKFTKIKYNFNLFNDMKVKILKFFVLWVVKSFRPQISQFPWISRKNPFKTEKQFYKHINWSKKKTSFSQLQKNW